MMRLTFSESGQDLGGRKDIKKTVLNHTTHLLSLHPLMVSSSLLIRTAVTVNQVY